MKLSVIFARKNVNTSFPGENGGKSIFVKTFKAVVAAKSRHGIKYLFNGRDKMSNE